jgi:Ca2+-binding RTX toxin-like protein
MSFIPPDPSLTLNDFSNLIGGSPTEVSLPDGQTAWISPSPNEGTTIKILDDGTIVLEGPPGQQLGFFSPDTNLNIRIVGSSQGDVIVTGGNSTIEGADGADTIQITGEGNSYVLGGRDNDRITGGDGDDTLRGGKGDDYITGGEGDSNDLIFGDLGNDTLGGRGGNDTIYGGKGDDCIGGHEGDDVLLGDMGDDSVYGGVGNDTVRGGKDNDIVDGGEGSDLVLGDRGNDTVLGGAGNDTVHGGKGDDLVNGGEGDDILSGEIGDDTIILGWGNNLASGGEGADVFEISVSSVGQVNNIADLGIDTITDFTAFEDVIKLDDQIFMALSGPGGLLPSEFVTIANFDASNPATAGTANLVYDDATGSIYYISPGSQVNKIIELANRPNNLSADDFEII